MSVCFNFTVVEEGQYKWKYLKCMLEADPNEKVNNMTAKIRKHIRFILTKSQNMYIWEISLFVN